MLSHPQTVPIRGGMELVLDLHGDSLEKAKFCVLHTLAQAYNVSKIRVITGRGNHISKSGERGLLYKEFRSWLTESSYQNRIEKVLPFDGYYEIHLRGNSTEQKLTQLTRYLFSDLFPDIQATRLKADQGDPGCQFAVGVYLTEKAKNDQELKEAFQYFLKAAKNLHAKAMISVARSYLMGRGVKQDDAQGIEWSKAALNAGEFEAALLLGDCYWNGFGVSQNDAKAAFYYQLAADKNDPVGMRKLAFAYLKGLGVKKDEKMSFHWYKKAADLGEVTSQYNVAVKLESMLDEKSTAVDKKQVFDYFLRSAEGGDPDAQGAVGYEYTIGRFIDANQERAHFWLNLAAENGNAQAADFLSRNETKNETLLKKSAQSGNIIASMQLKLSQNKMPPTRMNLAKVLEESYLELRDLSLSAIRSLGLESRFFLLDHMVISDQNIKYRSRALEALKDFASDGCVFSLRRLVDIYHHGGMDVQKDDAQAMVYIEQGHKLKDGKLTMTLAIAYMEGSYGKVVSHEKAVAYCEEAASFGYPFAYFSLGILHFPRGLVSLDPPKEEVQKVITYLQKAIELEKDPSTQQRFSSGLYDIYNGVKQHAAFRLAMIHLLNRSGSIEKMEKGYKYLQLAAKWGSEDAKETLASAKKEGVLDRMPHQWFESVDLEDELTGTSTQLITSSSLESKETKAQPSKSHSSAISKPPFSSTSLSCSVSLSQIHQSNELTAAMASLSMGKNVSSSSSSSDKCSHSAVTSHLIQPSTSSTEAPVVFLETLSAMSNQAENCRKLITIEEVMKLIEKVQSKILISNNVISRTECPYYCENKAVPQALKSFKNRIIAYRSQSSQIINDLKEVPLSNLPYEYSSLAHGTFAHSFVGTLVVASFGIGECSECATQIILNLANAGYSELAFVGLSLPNAKIGMEMSHALVVANLKKPPTKKTSSVYDFFKLLPLEAIVIDAFLGLSFSPGNVSTKFKEYIEAYGGEAKLIQFNHFYNLSPKTFQSYISLAVSVKSKMLSNFTPPPEDTYSLSEKTKIEDSTLIRLLKSKTKLAFFGVWDCEYKVDAVVEVSDEKNQQKLMDLQRSLKCHGRFFDTKDKKKIFVFEGINMPEGNPSIGKRIYELLLTKT